MRKAAACTATIFAFGSLTTPAQAYNSSTHSRIAEMAVTTMTSVEPIVFPPQDFTEAQKQEFAEFMGAVRVAPDKLWHLKSGLPLTSDVGLTLSYTPPEGTAETARYPFQDVESSQNCAYYDDQNLDLINQFRVVDLHHYPVRTGQPCGVKVPKDPAVVLSKVMGFHAADVDDHLNDTVLWVRPSSALGAGYAVDLLSRAVDLGIGMFLAPFVCLYEFIDSGDCNPNDAPDIAREINPVRYAAGLLPGAGYSRSSDYTGLWHFIDMGAQTNRYNDHRGMFYEEAGPSFPGAVDVAIMAGMDLAGVSLHAGVMDGDDRYGENDRVSRGDIAWQSVPVGHIEFSPIDNLAKYGWDQYQTSGFTDAGFLGYVMHALGDASAPHHVTGTTSWGHRPYEEYAARIEEKVLRFDDKAQRDRILMAAFERWRAFKSDEDVRAYVTTVAYDTYRQVMTFDRWAFNDVASVEYLLGDSGADRAADMYTGTDEDIEALLEQSASATLAFLVVAASKARDPGLDPSIACPSSTHYVATRGCQPGVRTDPFVPTLVLSGVCPSNTTCQEVNTGGSGAGGSNGGSGGSPPIVCTPACGLNLACGFGERCYSDGCCRTPVH